MGEFSHISVEFDNVVSVVLENYGGISQSSTAAGNQDNKVASIDKELSPAEAETRIASWTKIVDDRDKAIVSVIYMSCSVLLSKDGAGRMLKPQVLVEVWSTEHGLALYVLQDVQLLMERSGSAKHALPVVHPDQAS
ncbi:unnamed protein product [Arabis nemorensis]|uniref:Uncharacterized protein n=1 Tax=Arabis nemorensis TaxID=586526 RepID=A0A565CTU1_9BRAS|nr:unnamed protein product [Arabis nemorensis]